MDKKFIAAVCVVVAGAALGAYFLVTPAPQIEPKQSEITVTDLAGRQVTVKVPAERVVVAHPKEFYTLALVGGEDAIKKIVGWGSSLELYDRDAYLKYKEKFPEIENIQEVGSHSKGTFSVEKVISLKPDVVIFPKWLADTEGVAADIAKLEQAGIPSTITDIGMTDPQDTVSSLLLLGTVLGKEERAREIVDFYQKRINTLVARLQKMDKPKPKVYVEGGFKGPSEYGNTYGGDSYFWSPLIREAGGINIAEGVLKVRWAPINPEYLLRENPDIIIITGLPGRIPGVTRLSYYATPEESRRLLKAFTERPGWNTLSAVQNGRVYSIYHGWGGDMIEHFVALEALAKWFYPDEFKDLDPEERVKEFHERFLPVNYSGVWMLSLEEEKP